MSARGYLGIDLGGTGAKAGVFDPSGRLLGFGRRSYAPSVSSSGHAEIPIEHLYEGARCAVAEAVSSSGAEIRALAVASQGQTFVSLDKDGHPLHPAIIWYDGRAAQQADRLRSTVLEREVTGAMPVIEAVAVAPKVMWLREHHPDAMSRAARFLLLPDYLSCRLTGEAVTDPSTAASTGLYADDTPDYCPEALDAACIDTAQLGRIQAPGTPIARVRPDFADGWGVNGDALMVTGTNDQYAGALGAGNCRPGIVSETTGTCLALVTLAEKLPDLMPPGLLRGRFPISRYQFALAYVKTAGLVLQWFNRELCPGISLGELDRMAAEVPVGSRGVVVSPHFDGIVSPNPDSAARGCIRNLSLGHSLADIYRAVLESLAFAMRENLEFLRSMGFCVETVRSIGGGAKSDLWLQMKADVTGLPVERPAVPEAACLGAAALAAVGAGEFESIEQAAEVFYAPGRIFEPNEHSHELYHQPYKAYLELCEVRHA